MHSSSPPRWTSRTFLLSFSFLLAVAIQFSSQAPSPDQRRLGIAYGPFRDLGPGSGETVTQEQVRSDLTMLKNVFHANAVRTYGTSVGLENVALVSRELGLDAWVGAWISDDGPNNVHEVNRACDQSDDVVVVGNEYVHFAPDQAAAIEFLKPYWTQAQQCGKRVAYAESSPVWRQYPEIASFVDIALVHSYSFWDADTCTTRDAAEAALTTYSDFLLAKSILEPYGKPVLLGETGWPSDGCSRNCSIEFQADYFDRFLEEFMQLPDAESSSIFLFESFDEPYKNEGPQCGGDQFAKYWGLATVDRELKEAGQVVARHFLSSTSGKSGLSLCRSLVLLFVLAMLISC